MYRSKITEVQFTYTVRISTKNNFMAIFFPLVRTKLFVPANIPYIFKLVFA